MILNIAAFFWAIITFFFFFIPVKKNLLWHHHVFRQFTSTWLILNLQHWCNSDWWNWWQHPPSLHPLPEGRPLLSRPRESRRGCLRLDLGMMAGGETWPRLWALRRPRRRRPSIKCLRVQPRSGSYIHPGSWWMTISYGFLIISKEAKGKKEVQTLEHLVVLVNPCLC